MRPFTGGRGAVVSIKLLYDGKKCEPSDESGGARVTVEQPLKSNKFLSVMTYHKISSIEVPQHISFGEFLIPIPKSVDHHECT